MFRSRGENLRTVYVLCFLTVAFYLLEHQDAARYAALFSFDPNAFYDGQIWRLFTWQFTQAGAGWMSFPKPLMLFLTLFLLYLMGSAVEEEWGSWHFLLFFAISTAGSAAIAMSLGITILGSYFVNFSLLFVYASVFPEQTFHIFGVVPVKMRWLAYLAAFLLVYGTFAGGATNLAALGGALTGYAYYLIHRVRIVAPPPVKEPRISGKDAMAIRNAARFVAVKRAIAKGSAVDVDRLADQCDRDTVRGVNICPPADYKPENSDGYCIRCEGFSECSARYLRMNRPRTVEPPDATPLAEA